MTSKLQRLIRQAERATIDWERNHPNPDCTPLPDSIMALWTAVHQQQQKESK